MASETKKKCCRTCLKEDTLMFDLFIERLESSNLAEILVACTKLKIQEDDSLPKQICRYCYNCLVSFSHFCNMAQKAENKLKEAMLNSDGFSQNNSEGDQFEIKIENSFYDNILTSQEDNYDNHASLDENKNSETHNSNTFHNDCKVVEAKADNNLNCLYCNKHFSKPSKLKHHEEKHLSKSRCKLGTVTKQNENAIPTEGSPDLNVRSNSTNPDLICIICSSRFESMNLLSAHLKSHDEQDWVIACDQCSKVFKKDSHLKRHRMIHSHTFPTIDLLNIITPKDNVNTNICEQNLDQFRCSKCFLTFKNTNSLSAHMRKHTEKGRIISCKECKKVFKKLSHLKRHEIQHEINCPYKCTVCPKSFPTEDALRDHVNKHRGVKPHGCPVCGKKFSHLSTLTAHIKIHTRDKSFLCPTCGKKFDSSTNLNQHISRHIGLKEFACTLCPKRFVSKGELKSHSITHTGERSYTCDQCGATFTKRSSLTKHKKRHLGLKPHQCATCLMRFTCKDHLKRHYRIHTGEKPYKCDMCDRAYTQSNDLIKHRRSHVGEKVYKCPQCTESFRLNVELRQHISEHFVSSQNSFAVDPTPTGGGQTVVAGLEPEPCEPCPGVSTQLS